MDKLFGFASGGPVTDGDKGYTVGVDKPQERGARFSGLVRGSLGKIVWYSRNPHSSPFFVDIS